MAMLKSIMINTLRESTESEAVWELRRAFLNQNWDVNADTQTKNHIIEVSQQFVNMALNDVYEYPHYLIQEIYQRSWGLRDDINKAKNKLAAASSANSFSSTNPLSYSQTGSSNAMLQQTTSVSVSDSVVDTNALSVIPAKKSKRVQLKESMKGKRKPRYANAPSIASTFVKASAPQGTETSPDVNTTFVTNNTMPGNTAVTAASNGSWGVPPTRYASGPMKTSMNGFPVIKATTTVNYAATENRTMFVKNNNNNDPYSNISSSSNCSSSDLKPTSVSSNSNFDLADSFSSKVPQTHMPISSNSFDSKNPVNCGPPLQGLHRAVPNNPTLFKTSIDRPSVSTKQTQEMAAVKDEKNPQGKGISSCEDEDLIFENMQKLSPILDMANQYSEMLEKGCLNNPFNDLKTCAVSVDQQIKCTSKSKVNPDGSKVICCHVFVNDIRLASISVPGGSSPGEARRKLAETALEKIRLPYLRIISNSEDGLQLELDGSEQPFDEDEDFDDDDEEGDDVEEDLNSEWGMEHNAYAGSFSLTPLSKTEVTDPLVKSACSSRTAETQKVNAEFDSYVAWRKESNPIMKRIRQLGHMYLTLPASNSSLPDILKFLVKVSKVEMELRAGEVACTYDLMMDRDFVLASCNADNEERANCLVSEAFFEKVRLPYLCLKSKRLSASLKPFPAMTRKEMESNHIIYDSWHAKAPDSAKRTVRFRNFYLYQVASVMPYCTVMASAKLLKRRLTRKIFKMKPRGKYGIYMDGVLIGCASGDGVRKARVIAGEKCYENLKKGHWILLEDKLAKRHKTITVDDLGEYLPKKDAQVEVAALDASNLGHRLLSKMGWSGGGVGKEDNGIVEPIAVKLLSKNAGLGFQNLPSSSLYSAMRSNNISSISNLTMDEIIQRYAETPFHRKLIVPQMERNEIPPIQSKAAKCNLICEIRGKRVKRVVLSKKMDDKSFISTLITSGGRSDRFWFLPPEEVDSDQESPGDKQVMLKPNKGVQCNLLKAPPLITLETGGSKVGKVYNYEKCSDDEFDCGVDDNEGLEDEDEDNEEDDDMANHLQLVPKRKRLQRMPKKSQLKKQRRKFRKMNAPMT